MEIIHTIKMVTYIIAKQLGGKPVITVSGEELGRLDDVVFDEGS